MCILFSPKKVPLVSKTMQFEEEMIIYDICVFPSQYVIVTHRNGMSLFDLSNYSDVVTPLDTYRLETSYTLETYIVTVVADNKFAMACCFRKEIKFFQVLNERIVVSVDRSIILKDPCLGLHYSDKTLFAVTDTPYAMVLLDLEGTVLSYVSMDYLPMHRTYFCYNPITKMIYMYSDIRNRLFAITRSGHNIKIVEKVPCVDSLVVTETDEVYVSCINGLYNLNMKSGEVIKFGSVDPRPCHIAYSETQKKLYVAYRKGICIYK